MIPQSLIDAAADASEQFGDDECEAYAAQASINRRNAAIGREMGQPPEQPGSVGRPAHTGGRQP
jgi:hypothetical protein